MVERIIAQDGWRFRSRAWVFPAPSGFYGHGDDAAIPDTPLDEWTVQIEALLEERGMSWLAPQTEEDMVRLVRNSRILALRAVGQSKASIARLYGVSPLTVGSVENDGRWLRRHWERKKTPQRLIEVATMVPPNGGKH
jgi:hypothetical protein